MHLPPRRAPAHRARRRAVRRVLTAVLSLTAATALYAAPNATAAGQSVTVDLSTTQGAVTGAGSGFLYGLTEDGSGPGDSLLAPLALRSGRGGGAHLDGDGWAGDGYTAGNGYQRRLTSALGQARRLQSSHGTYDLLVSDVWGADTTQAADTVYPCTNGDCSNWKAFLDRLAADVDASGVPVRFDIWNEPAGAFFPPGFNTQQYDDMWDTAVRELRAHVPNAVIVGPSLWDFSPGNISPFLDHAKAAGTVPNVLNWHFSTDPVADTATARSLLSSKGISGVSLSMNEYIHADEQHAGFTAWYLSRIAQSGLSSASHAIWDDCCVAGTLDGILGNSGGSLQPTGQWWVYRAYAGLTGSYARTTATGPVSAVAAVDRSAHHAGVVLGDSDGSTPATALTLTGLTSPAVAGSSGVVVTVQRIPDQSPLPAPTTVTTQRVPAGTSSVTVPVTWQSGQDAFSVSITPAT